MDSQSLMDLLKEMEAGRINPSAALDQLKNLPFEDIGYARIDHHRSLRMGTPEVIYCEGKQLDQIQGIIKQMMPHHFNILATRANQDVYEAIQAVAENCIYHDLARIVVVNPQKILQVGRIAIVAAGTSDIPVAEEAAVTAETMGNRVDRIFDAGVAGIHRILHARKDLFEARVAVVVAGMEGALTSVVGGLVSCPVIGVPTSVGYGASFGGLAALLGMLNSCAPGVSVVNIDNGFGAGFQAGLINTQIVSASNGSGDNDDSGT